MLWAITSGDAAIAFDALAHLAGFFVSLAHIGFPSLFSFENKKPTGGYSQWVRLLRLFIRLF
jgi:hypothetical protein